MRGPLGPLPCKQLKMDLESMEDKNAELEVERLSGELDTLAQKEKTLQKENIKWYLLTLYLIN